MSPASPDPPELTSPDAVTVVGGIVRPTVALIAHYGRFEERVERYARYLSAVSRTVWSTRAPGSFAACCERGARVVSTRLDGATSSGCAGPPTAPSVGAGSW